ncbi:uncharacterized protein LOC100888967 [Strongylocentrotus purpuratus]|uniref:arylamine N-acetyltransferase n=1 Tax=Strongylocentrotus purpuratus TaxID=7668 RepID=A0A7M7NA24_STRPU|nr:uncharacterized protein LOC100888967 [Strongylocentrotus purpuratus]
MFSCGLISSFRPCIVTASSSYPVSQCMSHSYILSNPMKFCHKSIKSIAISKLIHQKAHKKDRQKCSSQTPVLDSLRLTSHEACHYLRHTLGIDSADTKLSRDRFGLLREITLRSHFRQPFQNVTNTYAIPLSERRIPSWDEIKQTMLAGQGGVCYELNVFTNRLLAVLGYNVHLIGGKFMGHDRYHVTNIVHDVEVKGQRHLVEVGASDPTFHPIPLDFEEESPVYQDSFLTYKFKLGRNDLQRFHVIRKSDSDSSLLEDHTHPTNWRLISEMDIATDRDLDYFKEPMSYVFNALPRPKMKMFDEGMFAMIYENGKMVYIRDNLLYLERNDNTEERRVLWSTDEVLEAYSRFMPMIPNERKLLGLKNRNLVFPPWDKDKCVTVSPIVRYGNAVDLSKIYATK